MHVQFLHASVILIYFQDIKVNCLAVINDTVGALMSCAHSDNLCAIGLILGKCHACQNYAGSVMCKKYSRMFFFVSELPESNHLTVSWTC